MPETKPPQIDIQALLQGGICPTTSTLWVDGEVTSGMASYLARGLHALILAKHPITIYLNTPGGQVDAAFGMFDLIKACPEHVTIIGYGEIASAGVLLLQAGDYRVLTKNCRVLVHPGFGSIAENMQQNIESNAKSHRDLGNMFYTEIGKSMGLNLKEMHARFTWDTWLSAKQAVKLGLADRVL